MSVSSADPRLAYLRTRLPARLWGPLVVFLSVAGLGAGPRPSARVAVTACSLAWGLVLQFRLGDDLADIPRDRRRHPERVLSRAGTTVPFWGLVGTAAVLNVGVIALRAGSGPRLLAFGVLGGILGLWYGGLREAWPNPIVGYHVVLAKYPVFVYLLSAPVPPTAGRVHWRLVLAMAFVYLCLCVYEALHDADLTGVPGVQVVLAVEMTALVALSALTSIALVARGLPASLLHGAGTLAGAGALAWLFACHRTDRDAGAGRYAVFALGFLEVLTLSLEAVA